MRREEGGFTYLALLFAVAISSVAMAGTAALWSLEARREKEVSLLFVGQQYRAAIASYYANGLGDAKVYPAKLDDLLEDRRDGVPRRHLRSPYLDPITNSARWGLVRAPGGAIIGVHSLSTERPLKRRGFTDDNLRFADKQHYQEWQFIADQGYMLHMPAVFRPPPQ